jgi:hypothetical protein
MVEIAQRVFRAAAQRARDLVSLHRAERAARVISPARRSLALRYFRAAVLRTKVADRLRDTDSAIAALRLYREAYQLQAAAIAVARGDSTDPDTVAGPAAREALVELARTGRIPALPSGVEEAGLHLSRTELLAFDGEPMQELLAKRENVESALRWLRDLIEPKTARRIQIERAAAIGAVALVVIAVMTTLSRPPNIALHSSVVISQRHPSSKAPADNSGLVNGEIESTYGIHTAVKNAWVLVQLDGVHAISKVKVYNRADGWLDDGLPMTMEMSEDGKNFVEVDRRTTRFTSANPWVFEAAGRRVREIRLRSPAYIALTELEVYEQR